MTDITKNAIEWSEKKKKISYDINVKMLEMIDELAEISHCTRAQILDTIIFPGTKAQVETMINAWKEWIKDSKFADKEKQDRMKKLIKDVENYKKKWGLDQFPLLLKKSLDGTKKMNYPKK